MNKYLILLVVPLLFIFSCSKDDDGDPDDNNQNCENMDLSYGQDIKAIIDTHCALAACHGGDPSIPDYTSYQGVFARRSLIRTRVRERSMPPAGNAALSQSDIDKISCWVDNGAPE